MSGAREVDPWQGAPAIDETFEGICSEPQDPVGSFFNKAELIQELGSYAHAVLVNIHSGRSQTRALNITTRLLERYHDIAKAKKPEDLLVVSRRYTNFAQFLIRDQLANTQTEIALDIINEGLEPFKDISPIHIAESIRQREIQYDDTMKLVVLAVKLWTLDRVDRREHLITSHFEQLHAAQLR